MIKNIFLFLIMMWAGIFHSVSQQNISESARNILGSIQKMEVMYPQQKVYLHIDKEEYVAGEIMWLKSYVVGLADHLPDTMDANLYIEMINMNEEPVDVVLLQSENGFGDGHIILADSLPEGNYLVRAYTNWMNNFDQDFFFEQEIFVYNPIEENFIRRREIRRNRRFNRELRKQRDENEFHVFPEGGNLVENLENRVAFKATNGLGKGVEAEGRLVDDKNNEVAGFSTMHDGMGYFTFTPQEGHNYSVKVDFKEGGDIRVDLPQALKEGYVLKTTVNGDNIDVLIRSNFNPQTYGINPEVVILGQMRSRAYFFENAEVKDGEYFTSIPTELFPSGVCHITLFDANGLPLAERLVFINHEDIIPVEISTRSFDLDSLSALEVDVKVDVPGNQGQSPNLSMAVHGAEDGFEEVKSNIASYLLLTSDIGGNIENPWGFLSEHSAENLDLLMMTHGWRRFKWDSILAGSFPEINYMRASGITITGQVEPTSSGKPTGEIDIELAVNQDGYKVFSTTTDQEGRFVFPDLYFTDAFLAEFSIPRDRAGRNLKISLNSRDFDDLSYSKTPDTRLRTNTSKGEDWEKVSRPVTSIEQPWQKRSGEPSKIYAHADQVIYMQDIQGHFNSVYDVLRARATGFMVVDGQVMLRGPSSIELSSEPLYMIDGVTTHRNIFLNLPPSDLDRIEILKGPSTAIFGIRGTNGVLLAFTKRGNHENNRTVDYMLVGFQSPREFSLVNIQNDIYNKAEIYRTIYWKPQVTPDGKGEASFTFDMPFSSKNKRVIVEGIDQQGNLYFGEYLIE